MYMYPQLHISKLFRQPFFFCQISRGAVEINKIEIKGIIFWFEL